MKSNPPGPKARKVIARDSKVVSPSLTRAYELVVDHAKGCYVWDIDGNKYLDMAAFVAVASIGNSNPVVQRAVEKQVKKLTHPAFSDFYSELPVRFSEELLALMPPKLRNGRVFLSNSGTESVEAAYKLVKWNKRRKWVAAFNGSFHGRTMGSLSLTHSKKVHRDGFGPFLPAIHLPYAYCYRCPLGLKYPDCGMACIDVIEKKLKEKPISGLFVEPIQGEGGYIVPPKEFHKELRRICDEQDIIMVDDEVQAGYYRTGTFLAMQGFGVTPDIVSMSKPLGGGFPMGATIAPKELMDWPPGAHANTMGGNLIACAAGIASIKYARTHKLGQNAKKQGAYLLKLLKNLQERHELIGDVRGKGLMASIELVKKAKKPAKEERDKVLKECLREGLILLPCGESSIRFSPPLTITRKELDIAIPILDSALSKLTDKK